MEDQFFSYTMLMLRKSGIWPKTTGEFFLGIVVLVVIILATLMHIPEMDPSNIEEFTFIGTGMVTAMVISVKTVILKMYQVRGEKMVLDTQVRCCLLLDEFPDLRMLLQRREMLLRRITKAFITFLVVVISCWMALPLLSGLGILTGIQASLPIKMWYPMDLNERHNLAIAVLHQMICFILCAIPYVMTNMIFIAFISLTCGQLEVLSHGLRSLDETNVRTRLPFCVELHSSILAFGRQLESLMSPVLLLIFVAYVAMICQCLVQLTTESMFSEHTIKFLGYFGMLLVEVWLYCFFGNQLIDYSKLIREAAYSCEWYNLDNSNKKSLSLVILRSERPLRLTIGKMYIVSLETFTEVLKFCYSVFTLLREVNKQ